MSERTARTLLLILSSVSGSMSVPILAHASTETLIGTGLAALSSALLFVLVPAPGTHEKILNASKRPPPPTGF